MRSNMLSWKNWKLAALLVCVCSMGCSAGPNTQRGALAGTALGTAAGAIVGHQSGHGAEGALVGAATGAVAGGLIGNAQDAREERDAAISQAAWTRSAEMLTNDDLVRMTVSGLSDDVIITAVQTKGGRFDLSPDGLIALKASGVSDRVLSAVQTAAVAGQTHYQSHETGTAVQGVLVVRPRPVVRVVPAPVRVVPRRKPRRVRRFWW